MNNWERHLAKDDLIIAAVSGGADSIAMLLRLADLAPNHGWRLRVVHVHHHLRPEADDDAAFVEEMARNLGLPFSLVHLHDDELQTRPEVSTSLEGRIREERLRLLREEARKHGARAIALGQHADDAAETFLLMALRGSGPTGLGSMREVRQIEDILLIRPLLHVSRNDLEEELRRRNQSWRTDPTNESFAMRRNRLRHEILPILEEVEPAARELLARSAELCGEEAELLDSLAGGESARAIASRRIQSVLVSIEALAGMNLTLRKAVLRRLWMEVQRMAKGADVSLPPPLETVKCLAAHLDIHGGAKAQFGPACGVKAEATGQELLIFSEHANAEEELTGHLSKLGRAVFLDAKQAAIPVLNSSQRYTPGRYEIPLPGGQGSLVLDVINAEDFHADWNEESFQAHRWAAIDARAIRRDLYLRAADPLEKLPIGGGNTKEMGTVLQEARIPAPLRKRVACFGDDRGTLWVPYIRRAASGFITPRTELVVLARIESEQ